MHAMLLRSRGLRAASAAVARNKGGGSGLTATQTRSQSILGAIFGIGEFEGARNQSLRATTSKLQAYELALLEVQREMLLCVWARIVRCCVATDGCVLIVL